MYEISVGGDGGPEDGQGEDHHGGHNKGKVINAQKDHKTAKSMFQNGRKK